ncbi:MAG: anti-sigma F factor [Defluviitaleaceae bacterium]|nr:anti-sigma F factor [Defluviitaleaceae bacterium]MCL2238995.1 anti-sigma F factor [Defluviitaleaceae bacterium]
MQTHNEGKNKTVLEMESRSCNVSLARVMVAAFIAPVDPDVMELSDIKTAVSEAVTNAIIHGYGEDEAHIVRMTLTLSGRLLTVEVTDNGIGITDIAGAREPLFTTLPELERSGLGFTVMESFMDTVDVISTPGVGTTVTMTKDIKSNGAEHGA